jgi:hypothetical protein
MEMRGYSWANRFVGVSPALAALLVGACAAGDGGLTAENPFTTSPNPSAAATGSMTEATGAPTEGSGGATESADTGPPSTTPPADDTNTTPPPDDTIDPDPTENLDPDCQDMDDDGFGVDCDLGPDCDDNDFNNHTPEGCAGCADEDGDNWWLGCDQYGDDKPGPDCDDTNPDIGGMDAEELCNGKAENCAGEIDPLPADEMCPTMGDGDHVAPVGGWKCNMVPPGQDGCEVAACELGYYDADKLPNNGCECLGTDVTKALAACGDGPAGFKGTLAEGQMNAGIKGVIPFIDNGPANGLEDWYSVAFPVAMANGKRPNAGNISVSFATNPGDPANPDYRIEVFRACNGAAFDMGLASQFGAGAPPAREWTFFDNHPNPGNPMYKDDILWPEKVYIRVIRVNNSGKCGEYSLTINRAAN